MGGVFPPGKDVLQQNCSNLQIWKDDQKLVYFENKIRRFHYGYLHWFRASTFTTFDVIYSVLVIAFAVAVKYTA